MSIDKNISNIIFKEELRQNNGLELIASENYVSRAIRELCASVLTNKYAEGYPGKRYYAGCENVDIIEEYAQHLACQLFACEYANVQPHSGSQANFAAYKALMPDGGTILSMDLNSGGHLTHGSPVSFSGQLYKVVHYPLCFNGHINYAEMERLAIENKPNVIVVGGSAYPYTINFKRVREICDATGAKMMVDMSHFAGIVAANLCENPLAYADIVTSTTHKTLRGPRGGIILTNDEELYKAINKAVFPYTQGGPLMHIIAAKAQCFSEALTTGYKKYMEAVLRNTKLAGEVLGCTTNTHLILLNVRQRYDMDGAEAEKLLTSVGITVNKNMVPNDTGTPAKPDGIRLGFAAVTTRGCNVQKAIDIAHIIHMVLAKRISKAEAISLVATIAGTLRDIRML